MVPQAQPSLSQTRPAQRNVKRTPPAQRNSKRTPPAQRNMKRTPPAQQNTKRTPPAQQDIKRTSPAQRNAEKISQVQPKLEMESQAQANPKPTSQVRPSPRPSMGGASVCGVPTPAVAQGSDRHPLGGTTGDSHKTSPAADSGRTEHKEEPTEVKGLDEHALRDMDVDSDAPTGQSDPKLIKRGVRCDKYLNKIPPLASHLTVDGKRLLPTCSPVSFTSNARVDRGGRKEGLCGVALVRCFRASPHFIVGVSVSSVPFPPHVSTGL